MAEIELEGKDNEILSELSIWFDAQELVLDGLHYKIKDYHVFAEKVEEKLKTLAIGKRVCKHSFDPCVHVANVCPAGPETRVQSTSALQRGRVQRCCGSFLGSSHKDRRWQANRSKQTTRFWQSSSVQWTNPDNALRRYTVHLFSLSACAQPAPVLVALLT